MTMASTATITQRPVSAARLIFRPQAERVLVYNAGTDQLFALYPLGASILRKCDGTRSPAQIAAEELAGTPIVSAAGEAVVGRFLGELERHQLITWQPGDGPAGDDPAGRR
jgi:hypothetical protein